MPTTPTASSSAPNRTCRGENRTPSCDAAGVDVEASVADEAEKREAKLPRQFDGQCRWSADRGEDGDPGDDGFLHQLEAGAAADDQYRAAEWRAAVAKERSDHLVDGVMAADV